MEPDTTPPATSQAETTGGEAQSGDAFVLHVAAEVIAAIAAEHALTVPGVAGLRPRRSIAGLASRTNQPGSAVTVSASGSTHTVTIDLSVHLGGPIPQIARHVQQQIEEHLRHDTGIESTVCVNIVDVEADEPEQDTPQRPAPGPPQ